jgi:hypothetical protein
LILTNAAGSEIGAAACLWKNVAKVVAVLAIYASGIVSIMKYKKAN